MSTSLHEPLDGPTLRSAKPHPATFGRGGSEPYAAALTDENRQLYLVSNQRDGQAHAAPMNIDRWSAAADETEYSLLDGARGPILDIGCGPGRMVHAALELDLHAIGIDISPAALDVARAAKLPVLEASVFDVLPFEGNWGTALLLDGNIGIGGDPAALLERCSEILIQGGTLIVETNPDPSAMRCYDATVVDGHGAISASFPWAEIGVEALEHLAGRHGFKTATRYELDGRMFCLLVRR